MRCLANWDSNAVLSTLCVFTIWQFLIGLQIQSERNRTNAK